MCANNDDDWKRRQKNIRVDPWRLRNVTSTNRDRSLWLADYAHALKWQKLEQSANDKFSLPLWITISLPLFSLITSIITSKLTFFFNWARFAWSNFWHFPPSIQLSSQMNTEQVEWCTFWKLWNWWSRNTCRALLDWRCPFCYCQECRWWAMSATWVAQLMVLEFDHRVLLATSPLSRRLCCTDRSYSFLCAVVVSAKRLNTHCFK